jgi:hypothetical protein
VKSACQARPVFPRGACLVSARILARSLPDTLRPPSGRGSPVIVVHSRRFGADDTVVEYAEMTVRADARVAYRYQFTGDDT